MSAEAHLPRKPGSLYKPAGRCLRMVREQAGLTVEALAEKTGWSPETVEAVLERPEHLGLWHLCHEKHGDAEEKCAATICTLVDRDEVDHGMISFLTTLGTRYLALRQRLIGTAFDAGVKQAVVAALLQAEMAPEEWSRDNAPPEPQEVRGNDLRDLLHLAADLRAEHPRLADALLFAVACSAARLKDSALKLKYLVYVALGLTRFPKEAQALSAHSDQRTFSLGQLLFHLTDVWRIPFDAQVLHVMERFTGAIDPDALPEARKQDLTKVYEAMIRDVLARQGDAGSVRRAAAKVEAAYGARPVSTASVTVDFMTVALLAPGNVEGCRPVSALVATGSHFSAFLRGIPPVEELAGFPNVTRVLRELLAGGAGGTGGGAVKVGGLGPRKEP